MADMTVGQVLKGRQCISYSLVAIHRGMQVFARGHGDEVHSLGSMADIGDLSIDHELSVTLRPPYVREVRSDGTVVWEQLAFVQMGDMLQVQLRLSPPHEHEEERDGEQHRVE